jgi:methionyl-tRNA synthetase
MARKLITTPIYYINAAPHIGHTYTMVAADVLARYYREQGEDVMFTAGADENSQKTLQAVQKTGATDAVAYTNQMTALWQKTWQDMGISYDTFVRTTSPQHHAAVQAFLEKVQASGDLYKGSYEGLYCVGCEEFKRADDLVDGKCPLHNTEPEQLKEENYFFKLSKYQQPLLDHIRQHPEFVAPVSRRNEVLAFIERGLEDISFSRPSRGWGIPFPGDDKQVVYVWSDALVNYLTATGYPNPGYEQWWPASLHLVGKDIIKFHCIIWPAMLLSAGLPLPQQVFAHGFFTVAEQKISKSLGNAIAPSFIADKYGIDALRYYVLRDIPFGADGEVSFDRLHSVYHADLANELGNLVQRTATMVTKYLGGKLGPVEAHSHDASRYHEAMANLRFDKALEDVWERIKGLNQLIEEEKPWVLAKEDPEHLAEVLKHVVSDLLQIASLLLPFLPTTAVKIAQTFADGQVNPEVGILFPRVEEKLALPS